MDFHKIEFDGDLDELGEDKLRELVASFKQAQGANIEQFEEVTERVAKFEEYDSELTDELAEASPLSESELEAVSFSRKRELLEEFTTEEEQGGGEPLDDGGSECSPSEFGQRGETRSNGEETEDFITDVFDGIAGVEP